MMNIFKKIKYFFQRAKKGYCDKDIWNIDYWFVDTFSSMLDEFADKCEAYPDDKYETFLHWRKDLQHNAFLLRRSINSTKYLPNEYDDNSWDTKLDINSKHFSLEVVGDKERYEKYKEQNLINEEIANKNKDEFFEWLTNVFYDLWD